MLKMVVWRLVFKFSEEVISGNMRKGWGNFSSFISYEVGAGTQVKFYNDLWCVDQSLKGGFPELLRLARNRKASVADYYQFSEGNIHSDVTFLEQCKIGSWSPLYPLWSSLTLLKWEGGMSWNSSKCSVFEVKSTKCSIL